MHPTYYAFEGGSTNVVAGLGRQGRAKLEGHLPEEWSEMLYRLGTNARDDSRWFVRPGPLVAVSVWILLAVVGAQAQIPPVRYPRRINR